MTSRLHIQLVSNKAHELW